MNFLLKCTVRKDRGQAMMEYILVTGLVSIFCLVALKQFGRVLEKRIQHLKTELVEKAEIKK